MSESPTIHRVAFELREDLEVVLWGDRLLVYAGNETHELTGPDATAAARVLEGLSAGSSSGTVLGAFGVPPETFARLVSEFETRGFLLPRRGEDPAPTPSKPKSIGVLGSDRVAQLLPALLEGQASEVARYIPRSALAPTDVPPPGEAPSPTDLSLPLFDGRFADWARGRSLLVVSTPFVGPATHEMVNALCGEAGIPWLGLRGGRQFAEVGPFVRPPDSPCYVCYALRVVLNAPGPAPASGNGPAQLDLTAEERARTLAGHAAGLIRQWVRGGQRADPRWVWRFEWSSGEVFRTPVLKLPNCPGCEGWRVGVGR